ncbi:Ada metal-binding domain-containing protein [Desulfocurvibacter africanus]|uniref:sunset domain-containing protein n=1 Tax=Desulfocurvibacter africanus TaxID=873 RepID=UPI002FD8FBB5
MQPLKSGQMVRPTRLAAMLAGTLFKALRKYAWRRAALRPAYLLIFALIVMGLLLARALTPQPKLSMLPMPLANQTAQLDSSPETVLQAAHDAQGAQDAQPAGRTVGPATAAQASETGEAGGMEDRNAEHPVKQQEQAAIGPVSGNIQSKIFHLPGCRNYACKSCTQVFQSREEALAAGYRPCRQCAQ